MRAGTLGCIAAIYLLWIIMCMPLGAASLNKMLHEATEYNSLSQTFDYIIVGGGTAGCPLATTLSTRFKVLVLERGGSPYGNPNISRIENVAINSLYQGEDTPSQGFTSTDGVRNARARVLGGGTCINYGFYNRASPEFIREMGLDGKLANASFQWIEQRLVHVNKLQPYQAAFREALLEVGVTPDNGVSFDFRPGTQSGGTTFDSHGNRHPASDLLRYADSSNLVVILHAEVQLIIIEGTRALGVKYKDRAGKEHTALLNSNGYSEIILTAGTLGSPQLLLLSGIGPTNELKRMGISSKIDLPVGQNISDNPRVNLIFTSPPPYHNFSSLGQVVGITSPFGNFLGAASGDIVSAVTGSSRAAYIFEKVAGPRSTGKLVLKSLNVTDNPIVTFNYYKEKEDLETCVKGVKKLEEVMLSDAFKRYVFANQSLPSGGTIGERKGNSKFKVLNSRLERFCKDNMSTIFHYHGGCLVNEVLDIKDYGVIGMRGLRVVDASTFRYTPGTNPQATVLMLGRYFGSKILRMRSKQYSEAIFKAAA